MSEASAHLSSPAPSRLSPQCLNAETYAELRKIAHRHFARARSSANTLQATALVHEAWLRLSQRQTAWQDHGHFLASVVRTMRHILIDAARRKSRQRHGGGLARATTLTLSRLSAPEAEEQLLLIDEAVRAMEALHPERAQVVVARFFGGLTTEEIAGSLGISERSVDRHWAAAKVWLFRWMQGSSQHANLSAL